MTPAMTNPPRTKTQALAAAAEGMKAKCTWPHCVCKADHDRLYHEALRMGDESQPCPTAAEVDAMYVAAVVNLAGISACVTDRRERYIASISLLNPTFANDKFEAALARLCADAYDAPPTEPDPEPEPAPEPSYSGPTVDDIDYGPMFLGSAGRETFMQRKARHDAIARQRRATLHEVPKAAEPPAELEPKAVKGGGN
jgi:hypothetical protein